MLRAIVLLAGVCVWLLTERHSLTQQKTLLEEKVAAGQRQKTVLDGKIADLEARFQQLAQTPHEKKTWLQERIQQRGSLLESGPQPVYPTQAYPYSTRPATPGSRIIR